MSEIKKKVVKEASFSRVPPQSIEAEESILSAVLLNNNVLLEVLDILTPEDFYKSAHQKIFAAIIDLFKKGDPADLVTVTNHLKETGELQAIGGAAYLSVLVDEAPYAVNVNYYAKIVHDKSCLRFLIEKSNSITRRCFEDKGDVDDIMDFAEMAILDISQKKIKQAFFPISDIIENNIDVLEERQGTKALVTGIPSSFKQLDSLTAGFQNSDLIILAARPSMGKTAFALNVARNAALLGKIPVGFFSLEMSKEQLSMRLLCAEARVDSFRLRGGFLGKDEWGNLTDAAGVLSEAPIYIDDSPLLSVLEIRAKARRLKMEKGLGLVIIDYLQFVKSSTANERRELEVSEISRSLKGLAKELELPVIALAQLNRKVEDRSDKRPQLADLRESGSLEQDADVVAFIYRDEVYNKDPNNPNRGKAEIIVAKQRNGPTGTAVLTYINTYTRFENAADEYPA